MTTTKREDSLADWPLTWLTVEVLLWAAVGLLAAALRLAGLAARPMDPAEAQQAVAALSGLAAPGAGASPLLLSLQRISFFILQSGEGLARVWPALAGVATVLLVAGLRRDLGRVGALAAATLLAISPLLVFWSRNGTGESFALLAVLLLLVGLSRARRGEPWLVWMAVGLAMVALSSTTAYSVLVLAAPAAVLALVGRRSGDEQPWLTGLLVFVGLVVLGATALFFNPSGFAAAADLPAEWLRQFVRPSGESAFWLLAQLTLGEALALAAGVAGLVIGLKRRNWLALALGLWLALGLALLLVRAGRTAADAALLALPLALLAGIAVEAFAAQFSVAGQRAEAAVLTAACLVVLGASAIWLADYVHSLDATPRPVFLLSAGAALLMLLVILVTYTVVFGARVTWQVAALVGMIALGVLTLRMTTQTGHSQDPTRWSTLASARGAQDGQNLTAFLERLAAQRGTDLRDLPVTVVSAPGVEASPLLRWALRNADLRGGTGAAAGDAVLVSLADDPPPSASDSSTPLVGRSFRLVERWSPDGLRGNALWNWLLYGQFDGLESQQRAVVWLPAGAP